MEGGRIEITLQWCLHVLIGIAIACGHVCSCTSWLSSWPLPPTRLPVLLGVGRPSSAWCSAWWLPYPPHLVDWDGKWPTLTLKQPLLLKGTNSWWEGASMFRIQLWQIRHLLYTTNVYGYRQWQTEWNVSPNIWKLRCQKKCINGNDHQMCRSQNQRAMNETRKEVVKNYADTIIYAIGPEILVPTMCCCNNYFHLTKQHLIPHSLFSG